MNLGPGLLGLALALATACVSDPVTGERRFSLEDWTPEEERALGAQMASDLEADWGGVYPDEEAHRHLGRLVEEIWEAGARSEDFDVRFRILHTETCNALALPGGFVYVTRGLLEKLQSEAQFVSVMGHEIGHVEHRHAMLQHSRGAVVALPGAPLRVVGRIGRALGGRRLVDAAASIVRVPGALFNLGYGREQETEADERAVDLAIALGYDPRAALETFRLLDDLEEEAGGGARFEWARSHPGGEQRAEDLRRYLASEHPEIGTRRTEFRRGGEEWERLHARLVQRAPAYAKLAEAEALAAAEPTDLEAVRRLLDEVHAVVPDDPRVHLAIGEVDLLAGRNDEARRWLDSSREIYEASECAAVHPHVPLHRGLADLAEDRPRDALPHLEFAVRLRPGDAAMHFVFAAALERAADPRAAAEYDRVLELAPGDSPYAAAAREGRRRLRD